MSNVFVDTVCQAPHSLRLSFCFAAWLFLGCSARLLEYFDVYQFCAELTNGERMWRSVAKCLRTVLEMS